jgi:hypothetical protein
VLCIVQASSGKNNTLGPTRHVPAWLLGDFIKVGYCGQDSTGTLGSLLVAVSKL